MKINKNKNRISDKRGLCPCQKKVNFSVVEGVRLSTGVLD